MIAGTTHEFVETSPFAAEDENTIAGEIESVVVGRAALVKSNHPKVLTLQFFEGADEINDAGDAEMFGGSGAGFDGDRTQRRGTAFGENDAVDARPVSDPQKCAEILWVFHAIESQNEPGRSGLKGKK